MPVIALTPSWNAEAQRVSVPYTYVAAVLRAGGAPFVIPPSENDSAVCAALDRADGLILTGGDDVDPSVYGEEKLTCCGETTPVRDRLEQTLIRHALKRGIPVLGICRGIQILHAALGGTLYQDIAEQFGTQLKHPRSDIPIGDAHTVRIEKGSLLYSIFNAEECPVNSRHHQGLKSIAPGMRISAWAPNGLPEAIEAEDGRPVLGVQWHPEGLIERLPLQLCLFRWIVQEAQK